MKSIKSTAFLAALVIAISCNDVKKDDDKAVITELSRQETPMGPVSHNDNSNLDQTTVINEPGLDKKLSDKEEEAPDRRKEDDGKKQQQPPRQPPPAPEQVRRPEWDKKIIKTASINLEIKDYNSYYTSVREKVRSLGGYVAQENQTQSEYKTENSMIVKVPVDKFDDAMVSLTSNVLKVNERKVSSQDVTTEVVDTKSRIEAKKQVRQRYIDLLAQAKNMQEILNVQSEINGVQEEIESAAGRIEYLSHSSSFSTIQLTYYQITNAAAKDPELAIQPSFGQKIKDAFATGWEIVSSFFVVLITIWPLLLGSFFAFLLYKRIRNQKPKQA
jgi:hypothetical protein